MSREISPALNQDEAELYYSTLSEEQRRFIDSIRAAKSEGLRSRPSQRLVLGSSAPSPDWRGPLLDKVAELVDENLSGRSDMCKQFAALLRRGLYLLGVWARALEGQVRYLRHDGTWMIWGHAWVETDGGIIIDGNADSIIENPVVGGTLNPAPFWGHRNDVPQDRQIPRGKRLTARDDNDPDVLQVWLPDLKQWLIEQKLVK